MDDSVVESQTSSIDLANLRRDVCGRVSFREAQPTVSGNEISLAFASDKPVQHWFGYLQLSMDPSHIRTERLQRGLAVLLDHDPTKQIGITTGYTIGDDGILRATAKFSSSEHAQQIVRDITDGIRPFLSVGFVVHDLRAKGNIDGVDLFYSEDWEPLEVSVVSVPADISVGVGRSQGFVISEQKAVSAANFNNMESEMPKSTSAAENLPQEQTTNIREIHEWAEVLGEQSLLSRYLLEEPEPSVAGFKQYVRTERRLQAQQPPPLPPERVAAAQGGVELARTVRRGGPLRAFTGEGADLRAYRAGKFLQAVLTRDEAAVQYCREHGIRLTRMQTGTNNEAGGFLIPEELDTAIIDLRVQYGVFRRNTTTVAMTTETKSKPRRVGGLTAYPIGAGVAITQSTATWDRVNLVAKKWGVLAKWENEVSEDAIINLADDLANEAAYALAKTEDECGFNGDGGSAYHGITGVRFGLRGVDPVAGNIAGLQVAGANYAATTIDHILGMIGRLPQYAWQNGQVKFYCSRLVWATVLQRLALAQGGVTRTEVISDQLQPNFLGYPVELVDVMPVVSAPGQIFVLFGNLAMASMLGDRRDITVATSDSDGDDFARDQMSIRVTQRFDIVVHDVGTQSAAGAMVGLITQ